jgi:alanine racemase
MARQPHAHQQPAQPQAPEPARAQAQPAAPSAAEAGGVLTIDLAAIAANYKTLASRVLPGECAAVVKADAYGCGIDQVVGALSNVGCRTFFVAYLEEARQVRAKAPDAVIYVLNGFSAHASAGFADTQARPVINSTVELAEWDHFVSTGNRAGQAALHVDTGMNRLGMTIEEAAAIAGRVQSEKHGFALVMSHMPCAEQQNNPVNDQQIRQFRDVRAMFRGVASSLANSAAIFLDDSTYCDVVRPGIALFGGNPTPGRRNPMRPAIELKARILQVRNVARGATVGYGATWSAKRPSRVAVVAAGYADGILRAADMTERGTRDVVVGGKRCKVIGRVSMDLMTVDVTDFPEGAVRRDHMATLIGDGLELDEVAAQCGTISYELLTRLGRRFHRVWKS